MLMDANRRERNVSLTVKGADTDPALPNPPNNSPFWALRVWQPQGVILSGADALWLRLGRAGGLADHLAAGCGLLGEQIAHTALHDLHLDAVSWFKMCTNVLLFESGEYLSHFFGHFFSFHPLCLPSLLASFYWDAHI
jgi:hypothetical protein